MEGGTVDFKILIQWKKLFFVDHRWEKSPANNTANIKLRNTNKKVLNAQEEKNGNLIATIKK